MAADYGGSMHGAFDLSKLKAKAEASASVGAPTDVSYATVGTDANFAELIQLSQQVPVIVELWSPGSQLSATLAPVLERVVSEFRGRLVLARVDVDANPQLVQAFQAQSVPMVVAVLGGRPAALFDGAPAEEQVREALSSVVDAAAQMGISGTVDGVPRSAGSPSDDAAASSAPEPAEAPLSPVQQAAFDAIEAEDFEGAIAIYEKALVENPRDEESIAGLANAKLLKRLEIDPDTLTGIEGQLAMADHLFASQMFEAALSGLLDTWQDATAEEREVVRERLLEYFTLLGSDSPFVGPARARLASLLY